MSPSFFSLFKRGRYFRPSTPQVAVGGRVQRARGDRHEAERFAAAAIAFAWLHNLEIRRHFWKKICHFTGDASLSNNAQISVEPEDWADLLIVNQTPRGRTIYVVECKIGAGLGDIQNPSKPAFAKRNGYGVMLTTSDARKGTSYRFVLFGFPKTLRITQRPGKLRLLVQQRSWEDFADGFPASPFALDLATSLGKLNVGAFPASEVKTMKVNTKLSEIGGAVRTLDEVQRRLNWPSGRACASGFYHDQGKWFLGRDLMKSAKVPSSGKLTATIGPPHRALLWFGYQGDESQHTELAVYVYCGSETRQRKVRQGLAAKLKKFSVKADPPDRKYHCVRITTKGHHLANDADWFSAVIRVLGAQLRS